MSDILTRLRNWTHAVDAVPASDLMDEAADEIELLDAAHKASNSALLVIDSGFKNALAEIDRLRLTDEEREALTVMMGDYRRWGEPTSQIVRGLLERLK